MHAFERRGTGFHSPACATGASSREAVVAITLTADTTGTIFGDRSAAAMHGFVGYGLMWPKAAGLPRIIRSLKKTGKLQENVEHRQVKYLNNRLEADHGALKRLINPTREFKTLPTASATIEGFEIMRMIRKGHCLILEPTTTGEVRFVNRLFRHAA